MKKKLSASFWLLVAAMVSPGFVIINMDKFNKEMNIETDLPVNITMLKGAWQSKTDSSEQVILFDDSYCMMTDYHKENKKFNFTKGGRITLENNNLTLKTEFHSADKDKVGKTVTGRISFQNGQLTVQWRDKQQTWVRIDKGENPLSGCWRIDGRMQDGKMSPIPLRPRRTLKMLSGTRFQWAAINIATGEFSGTGGGTYTFKNGKYIEQIDFFSRDSSRVGAKLEFDGKIENGTWVHSGLSSKGDPIKETWIRYEAE